MSKMSWTDNEVWSPPHEPKWYDDQLPAKGNKVSKNSIIRGFELDPTNDLPFLCNNLIEYLKRVGEYDAIRDAKSSANLLTTLRHTHAKAWLAQAPCERLRHEDVTEKFRTSAAICIWEMMLSEVRHYKREGPVKTEQKASAISPQDSQHSRRSESVYPPSTSFFAIPRQILGKTLSGDAVPLAKAVYCLLDGATQDPVKVFPVIATLSKEHAHRATTGGIVTAGMIDFEKVREKISIKCKNFYTEGKTQLINAVSQLELEDDDEIHVCVLDHLDTCLLDGVYIELRNPGHSKEARVRRSGDSDNFARTKSPRRSLPPSRTLRGPSRTLFTSLGTLPPAPSNLPSQLRVPHPVSRSPASSSRIRTRASHSGNGAEPSNSQIRSKDTDSCRVAYQARRGASKAQSSRLNEDMNTHDNGRNKGRAKRSTIKEEDGDTDDSDYI